MTCHERGKHFCQVACLWERKFGKHFLHSLPMEVPRVIKWSQARFVCHGKGSPTALCRSFGYLAIRNETTRRGCVPWRSANQLTEHAKTASGGPFPLCPSGLGQTTIVQTSYLISLGSGGAWCFGPLQGNPANLGTIHWLGAWQLAV